MRAKSSLLCAVFCASAVLLACDARKDALKEFQRMDQEMIRLYCSPDVSVARKGLLEYCAAISKWSSEDGHSNIIDYNLTMAATYARLFVMEATAGDEKAGEPYYAKCTNYFHLNHLRLGGEDTGYSKEEVRRYVGYLDQHLNVLWKETSTVQRSP